MSKVIDSEKANVPAEIGDSTALIVDATSNDLTTQGTPASVIVSDTPAVLLAASNANRKSILISNNGIYNIFLGHDSSVTTSGTTMGILLAPKAIYSDSGFGLYTGDIYAICTNAVVSENVSVSERVA